ncbi:response regulator [Desulfosarcina cetonica]|uniref:response regulator n=1 Tax=Desulfosarcina cetonica TaxID=90730 RepID=UPI00278C73FC|nr:response regulator [Desulfosarcina cetonica]
MERNIHTFRTDAPHQPAIPVAATGQANLITVPILLRENLIGVLELEKHTVFTPADLQFVKGAAEMIAVALHAASIRAQEERLLKDNRQQAKALKIREAALEASRRELMAQNQALQASEHKLHLKQLELEAANAQMLKNTTALEAHMAVLEEQKQEMQRQNTALEHAHAELAEKARQLERSSQYKTEFMANMSHELRTPLNSILLLSRLLVEDKDDTLTDRQVAFARTIHSAGGDLINLINEILDLATVESGKVKIDIQSVALRSVADAMQASFAPLAEQNGIAFSIYLEPDLPEYVTTDGKRLKQIVKNFLSNAFKFTKKGNIDLKFALGQPPAEISAPDGPDSPCLAITVADTGIGIPADKQELIFEAFQQVDGSIGRTYGGTGLGLSISRLLAGLIGGTITLESREEEGSCFTLHLPLAPSTTLEHTSVKPPAIVAPISPQGRPPVVKAGVQTAATTPSPDFDPSAVETTHILIIASEAEATTALQAHARRNGFIPLMADRFATGLHLADHYLPKAIFIDPALPGGYGAPMIQRIKAFPGIRHIPVFALMPEESDPASVPQGAAGRIPMPIADDAIAAALAKSAQWANDPTRTVLVLDPRNRVGPRIIDAAGISTTRFISTTSVAEAVAALDRDPIDLLILDPKIDEGERRSLFEVLRRHPPLPIFFYFGRPAERRLKEAVDSDARGFDTTWIDGDDALLPALVAYLHLPLEALDESQQARLTAQDNDRFQLRGHRILLADDDMRTVFAISSILEDKGVTVLTGKNGKESLDKLDRSPEIDLIITDVMMADGDGYQAIRRIRGRARYQNVPIIALTAKAMPGDRARCIEAGADDYLAKPVNLDILTSMLKVWLNPQRVGPKANNTAHG